MAPHAIQVADRFHVCQNLTEATQLLLARCQAQIAAASKMEGAAQHASGHPVISIQERVWQGFLPTTAISAGSA